VKSLRFWLVAPSASLAIAALAMPDWPFIFRVGVVFAAVFLLAAALRALDDQVTRPLGAVANVLEGLRRGEHGLRVRAHKGSPLYDVHAELNALAESIHTQHLADRESAALLSTVLRELDVAVLAFDRHGRLQLVNPAAETLLGCSSARAVGKSAAELGVEAWLGPEEDIDASQTDVLRGAPGASLRRDGEPAHELVVVSHLGGALRSEERLAWQRLLRVLSHEISNSLSPIITITGAHKKLIEEGGSTPDDAGRRRGLDVIGRRASSCAIPRLVRTAHAAASSVVGAALGGTWIRRVASLETRDARGRRGAPATHAGRRSAISSSKC
jgi:PAS domain S-box-containing protein